MPEVKQCLKRNDGRDSLQKSQQLSLSSFSCFLAWSRLRIKRISITSGSVLRVVGPLPHPTSDPRSDSHSAILDGGNCAKGSDGSLLNDLTPQSAEGIEYFALFIVGDPQVIICKSRKASIPPRRVPAAEQFHCESAGDVVLSTFQTLGLELRWTGFF